MSDRIGSGFKVHKKSGAEVATGPGGRAITERVVRLGANELFGVVTEAGLKEPSPTVSRSSAWTTRGSAAAASRAIALRRRPGRRSNTRLS